MRKNCGFFDKKHNFGSVSISVPQTVRNKIIPQSKFVKLFMKQKFKCYFLLTLIVMRNRFLWLLERSKEKWIQSFESSHLLYANPMLQISRIDPLPLAWLRNSGPRFAKAAENNSKGVILKSERRCFGLSLHSSSWYLASPPW